MKRAARREGGTISDKLLGLLNEGIAAELQVSVQYMWHHVMCYGLSSESVGDVFKQIGIVEMKHAEQIAERLDYLSGVPATAPAPIDLYKRIIQVAHDEGDVTTKKLFTDILAEEGEHHNTLRTFLEK